MSNKFKSGLLIFMLVGPLLFFGLFHLFGTNHYSIPKLYPVGVENGDTLFHQIPEFTFLDKNSNKVTLSDFDDKVFVANFFSPNCPTKCPKVSKYLNYLQNSFKNHADEVSFLSHSITSGKSNVNEIKEYANLHEAQDGVWHIVTGEKNEIYKQAKDGYKLFNIDSENYFHNNKLVLIDKNKNIRGYFDGTNEKEVENLLSEIWILMYEQSK